MTRSHIIPHWECEKQQSELSEALLTQAFVPGQPHLATVLSLFNNLLPCVISFTSKYGILLAGRTSQNTLITERNDPPQCSVCKSIGLPLACLLLTNAIWRRHMS